MNVDEKCLEQFMDQHGNMFPYCDIKRTRRSLYPKWILMKMENPMVLFRPSGRFAWHTGCLPSATIQSIIVSGRGIPMPPLFCDVMDVMEWWGRNICFQWEQDVLQMFADYLQPGSYEDSPSKEQLFYDVIELLVERKSKACFPASLHKVDRILLDWQCFYHHVFENKSHDFFQLAVKSLECTRDLIEAYMYEDMDAE